MACLSPGAGASTFNGSDTARKAPITQGVPLSHNTMKQILVRSPLHLKVCRCWTPISNIKNMASQAVVTEEMEAIEAGEASKKKTMRWQRWQAHETIALIAAKKQQDLRDVKGIDGPGIESKKTKNKWKEIEALCREKGIERSAQQCQARWSRLMSAFTHIRSWEATRKPEQPSFWSLKLDERKAMGFLLSLDQKIYNALDELHNTKVDAITNTVVNDNVEEVAELESVNDMPRGYEGKNYNANETDVNCSSVQECVRENQVDDCKTMESTNIIINEFREMVVDDEKAAQLLHANVGSNPTDLHTETIDGSKDSCRGPLLMDEPNGSQMLHARAENVDCYPTSLHTVLQAEPSKSLGILENISFQIGCDQKHANDNVQVLPTSARIDGSNKDSCKGSLEEHGAEGNTVIALQDDVNVPFSHVMYDKKIQAVKDEGAVKSADSSLFKTNVSVIDSQVVGDVANANSVSALSEESSECEKSKGHLSSLGVDALNVNESMQITATESSCISIDKEACKNDSVDRNLTEAACSDKIQTVESVFEICEDNSSRLTNAEVILTASADNIQSIGTQIKADAWQMGEGTVAQSNNLDLLGEEAFGKSQTVLHTRFEQQERDSNPFLASKEEISLDVLNQGSEDNSRSKLFESISSDQGKDFKKIEKVELLHSEEGNITMIADMTERNAHMLESSAGHSFDKKEVQDLQNGHDTEAEQFGRELKDMDTFVKREPFDDLQSIYDKNRHGSIGRTKLDINDSDTTTGMIGIRTSMVDTNTPAPTRTMPQFQQAGSASEQKSTIKGDCGSFESVCETNRRELLKLAAEVSSNLELTIKDDRVNPVTSGKESMGNRSPMTTTSSTADEDVFMYIPAAIGNLFKSSLQTIRKIFKF